MHLTLNVVVTGFNPIQTLSAHVIKGTFLLVFYSLKMVIMANLDGHQGTTILPPHLSIGVILSGNKRNRHRQEVVLGHIFPRAKVTSIQIGNNYSFNIMLLLGSRYENENTLKI